MSNGTTWIGQTTWPGPAWFHAQYPQATWVQYMVWYYSGQPGSTVGGFPASPGYTMTFGGKPYTEYIRQQEKILGPWGTYPYPHTKIIGRAKDRRNW